MVIGVFKVPSFLKRNHNPSQRLESTGSPTSSAASSPKTKREQRPRTTSEPAEVTANIDIPQKKHTRRVRTISGSSGHSCQSEPTPRSRRMHVGSAGSNFSGDSIVHHLDKLSERDQVWFQAYRFGGR